VDHLLHGGDVGFQSIILELEDLAPVTAVLGNTDSDDGVLRPTEVVQLASRKFLLHHIVNPHALGDHIRRHIKKEKPDVVVFGHTHKPFNERINGTLFFNPGYAGKPKFGQERSVAILHCTEAGIRPEFLPL
jgi:putative phosphoesterase